VCRNTAAAEKQKKDRAPNNAVSKKLGLYTSGNVAKWLTRQIANLMPYGRAGSNPAVIVFFFSFLFYLPRVQQLKLYAAERERECVHVRWLTLHARMLEHLFLHYSCSRAAAMPLHTRRDVCRSSNRAAPNAA
jgi:hypothetical protein